MNPDQNRKQKSPVLMVVLVFIGLSSLCLILAVVVCAVFFLQTDAGRKIAENMMRNPHQDKKAEKSEEDYKQAIRMQEASRDSSSLMQAEFAYADWLQSNDRYTDAVPHYLAAEKIAKENDWVAWVAACLERRGWGQHKQYLNGLIDKPDYTLTERAVALQLQEEGEKSDNRADWLNELGILYSDNGEFEKARTALKQAARVEKTQEQDFIPETLLYQAEVELKQNRLSEAKQFLRQAAAYDLHDDAYSAYDEFLDYIQNFDDGSPRRTIARQVKSLLDAGDFEQLDKMADGLRSSKAMYPNGRWHLDTFYNAATTDDDDSEERWNACLAKVRKWCQETPESITARVVLAENLVSYAWRARGGGYANTVSSDQWKDFGGRIADAKRVLQDASQLKAKCPRWYDTTQDVMLGEGDSKAEYLKLVNECRKNWPTYWSSVFSQTWYLQPRWYGEGDEWVRAAQRISEQEGAGENADKAYARVIWALDTMNKYNNLFREFPSISWTRLQNGFGALQKEYPNSKWVQMEFEKLKTQAKASGKF